MIALVSFLLIVLLSVVVVKFGAIALQATGLSRDVAGFQAQSAFSGVGFTTKESESIVNNPLRRKILRILMLLGSAGLTSAVATLVLTFTTGSQTRSIFGYTFQNAAVFDLSLIAGAFFLLYLVSITHMLDSFIKWVFHVPLSRLRRDIFLYDYEHLLGLSKGFHIATFQVSAQNWMVGKTIGELRMAKEGIMVLGIARQIKGHEEFIGSPSLHFTIQKKDRITLYGHQEILANIAKRPKGTKGRSERNAAVQKAKILEDIQKLDEKKLTEVSELVSKDK